ncbi:S1 RNA-binding domain-containing protein [archaeon]|nr:S1 RNA-binding domain-containing protein [archaeon]
MVKKRGIPSFGEFVVCKITKVNPNSAFARLEEYNIEGMIHISEVSSGWVRDIRTFVKVGQSVIAKVINTGDNTVSLSLKRVDKKQENDKIREYKLNQRAEKMLEIAAKKLNKTIDQAYEEVGFLLQEKFGTMYDGFKAAMENPQMLKRRDVPDKWIDAIKEVAEKSIEQEEFEFRANLNIRTYKPNGIMIIKEVLDSVKKSGMGVKYIAAPTYLVTYKTKQAKKGEHKLTEVLDSAVAEAKGRADVDYEISRL